MASTDCPSKVANNSFVEGVHIHTQFVAYQPVEGPPGSLPQTLGVGNLLLSCSNMHADRSTAVMSPTPLACRCGMRQPVPEPTSNTRVVGPSSGMRDTVFCSLCRTVEVMVSSLSARGMLQSRVLLPVLSLLEEAPQST